MRGKMRSQKYRGILRMQEILLEQGLKRVMKDMRQEFLGNAWHIASRIEINKGLDNEAKIVTLGLGRLYIKLYESKGVQWLAERRSIKKLYS